MRLDLSRLTDVLAFCFGPGEIEVGHLCRRLCPANGIALDIGGNIGTTALAFAERTAEVGGLDPEHASRVGEVEDHDGPGLARRRLVSALGVDDPHADPGWTLLAARLVGLQQDRVVELASELRHAVLVHDALARQPERRCDRAVQLIAPDAARAALEAAGFHDARAGGQRQAKRAPREFVEQVDEGEGGAAETERFVVGNRPLAGTQERVQLERLAADVETTVGSAERGDRTPEHVG